ncbi:MULTISPECIES: gamma carbonic anhydrase family protein [unclassified Sphingomonas]|jgi:carbonic anhydrase/acetyltransferase-like protein (isoleucine patch superfamily)|uniref:gamma carbonic anhydrase family protein n=1 Tax=unclassified Sphingomonas TaxID=196159 RepID=UPI000E1089E0|nr:MULTISPECIES: gamma carbonic anhydrase family protein [unclassified Sphingomonas]AXJ95026.1 gamma carbonic anhydrase family protein [Sphingomonas sp. FARSPH]
MTIMMLNGITPVVGQGGFVAPGAQVIGNVTLGDEASIWFNAVVRGDNDPIVIGARSNVQDAAVIHADPGVPATIGRGVTIGHRAIVHGATIGDHSLIGMGAIVLNRAEIGAESLVGAGALVTEGKVFPPRSLIVGSPARVVRTLTDAEVAGLHLSAATYVANARRYAAELAVRDA